MGIMSKFKRRGLKIQLRNTILNDYRITWRFCTPFEESTYIKEILPKLFKEKVCIMALDSEMNFYKYENNEFITKHFQLNCDHGQLSGTIEFGEKYNVNKQEEHYLYEVAGMLIHRNVMFDDLDKTNTMYMVLQPIYLLYSGNKFRLYPMIKLRNKMIMIEYRVFPGDSKIDIKTFMNKYTDFLYRKIEKIEMDINLFKILFSNEEICLKKEGIHDGCKHTICSVPDGKYEYLKDLSLDIFYLITNSDEINWFGRTTYSLSANISEKQVAMLLFSAVGKLDRIPQNAMKNYREFNDYKHYVTVGNTVTVGNILNTYMFADTLDEEILFYITNVGYFRECVEKCNLDSDKELLNLYESILQLKYKYLNKYNHLVSIREIMNDLWIELKSEKIIEEIKELIELKLKKAEINKNRKLNNIQLYYSAVAVLLSCAPLYEYIVIPTYCQIYGIKYDDIENFLKIALFVGTVILFFMILSIIRFIFLKVKK